MTEETHDCSKMPHGYSISKDPEGWWVVQDATYKYMDKLEYCPFSGEHLKKEPCLVVDVDGIEIRNLTTYVLDLPIEKYRVIVRKQLMDAKVCHIYMGITYCYCNKSPEQTCNPTTWRTM